LTVFRSSKGGEVIDGSLVVVSLTLRVIPAGTPKFVSAKTRNPNPTVSVTCADDCCLRIGTQLSVTSTLLAIKICLHTSLHYIILLLLSSCRIHTVGPENRSPGIAPIVRLDEATQHRPFQLTPESKEGDVKWQLLSHLSNHTGVPCDSEPFRPHSTAERDVTLECISPVLEHLQRCCLRRSS
jgi:hypothetical protein